jgi:gliding motility-associated lipoprotein GldD
MNLLKIKLSRGILAIGLVLLLFSCDTENYYPKPMGFHRIELPAERVYNTYNEACPFSFEHPNYSSVVQQKRCNHNIYFPNFKAVLYGTFIELTNDTLNDLFYHSEFSRELAYEHRIKADRIQERLFSNDSSKVFGIVYSIDGNVASNYQFFLSDSVSKFYRGSLYFDMAPNIDSIKPVLNHLREDIDNMIESFSWK